MYQTVNPKKSQQNRQNRVTNLGGVHGGTSRQGRTL